MKRQIYSKGLGQKIASVEGDAPSLTAAFLHETVERVFRHRLNVMYRVVLADTAKGHYAVECRITDREDMHSVVRIGEIQNPVQDPLTEAYEQAFTAAAKEILDLVLRKEKAEDKDDVVAPGVSLNDDMKLLIGGLKGKTVGEVKDTPQFEHFLENLIQTDGLSFPDDARNEQLSMLTEYARTVFGGEGAMS